MSKDLSSKYLVPILKGWGVTVATTPGTFVGNYISAVCANQSVGFREAFKHFRSDPTKGLGLHFAKEFGRTAIKVPLLREFRPYLNQQAKENGHPILGDLIYAAAVASSTEVPLNPIEAAKVRKQSGIESQGHMKGAATGVARQVPAWFLWTMCYRKTDEALIEQGQNPDDLKHLPFRATTITTGSMVPVYPITRMRYEMQTQACAQQLGRAMENYTYRAAFNNIVAAQGPKGVVAGFVGKFICNATSTVGALVIAGFGKETPTHVERLKGEGEEKSQSNSIQ